MASTTNLVIRYLMDVTTGKFFYVVILKIILNLAWDIIKFNGLKSK